MLLRPAVTSAYAPARSTGANAWLVVTCLWVALLLTYVARQSIFSIFPVLRRELQFTEVQLGLTGTVFLWVYALASPLAGRVADRFSRSWLVALSLFLSALVLVGMGASHSAASLLGLRGALALVQAVYMPAAVSLIAAWHTKHSRSTALALHGTGQFAGVILGGWYGGWLAEALGWRAMFLILAAALAAYALLVRFGLRPADAAPPRIAARPAVGPVRVLALLAIPTFAAICFSVVAVNGMLWLLYTWLPDLLRARFHLSLQNAGLLATGYVQTALIAGLFCGGPAGDYLMRWGRYGRICVMISGLAVCAPFVYWIGRSESLDGVRLAAAGYGFFKGLFTANYVAAALDLLPDNAHGFCSGILNAIGGLAGGLAAYLFGLFQGRFAVGEMFGVASVLGLVAALVLAATAWRFFAKDYARYHTAAALM